MEPMTVSTINLDSDGYVREVLALDRERVTNVYRALYPDHLYWEGMNENGDPCEYVRGGLLTVSGVTAFAEQDFYDGPDAWAFQAR